MRTVSRDEMTLRFLEMAPAMERACHDEGLPYLVCLPTLRGFALLETDWGEFRAAYLEQVRLMDARGTAAFVII